MMRGVVLSLSGDGISSNLNFRPPPLQTKELPDSERTRCLEREALREGWS